MCELLGFMRTAEKTPILRAPAFSRLSGSLFLLTPSFDIISSVVSSDTSSSPPATALMALAALLASSLCPHLPLWTPLDREHPCMLPPAPAALPALPGALLPRSSNYHLHAEQSFRFGAAHQRLVVKESLPLRSTRLHCGAPWMAENNPGPFTRP
eukprot:1160908-Pelagomonas_calceolata.AAC.17